METYWGFYDAETPKPEQNNENYPTCEICHNKLEYDYEYEQEKK